MNGFCLEVITEREVSQHLEECAVTRSLTDILNIAGTDTLLAGGHASSWRNLLSGKIWL